VNQLLKLRKKYPTLAKGKLKQIYTGGDLYILLKEYEDEVMMILINSGDEDILFPTQQTLLFFPSTKKLVNIKNNKENMINKKNTITLKGMNIQIYKINY